MESVLAGAARGVGRHSKVSAPVRRTADCHAGLPGFPGRPGQAGRRRLAPGLAPRVGCLTVRIVNRKSVITAAQGYRNREPHGYLTGDYPHGGVGHR
jgi:hypothetical protein